MLTEPIVLQVSTAKRSELRDITRQVQEQLTEAGIQNGAVCLFVPHTTAGLTINENVDPDVRDDMTRFLDRLVPREWGFRHAEGNSDAHIKASMMGFSLRLMVRGGRLCLGRWQGVYFCEFDGPRRREVWMTIEASS